MNLYGVEKGSHYRGKVLMQVSCYYEKEPKAITLPLKFKFPENPLPSTPVRSYLLRLDILEGHELPVREFGMVHAMMGPYLLTSNLMELDNGRAMWYQSLEKKLLFPENIEELPDLIFYYADKNSEEGRISFKRIKAKDILCKDDETTKQNQKPKTI